MASGIFSFQRRSISTNLSYGRYETCVNSGCPSRPTLKPISRLRSTLASGQRFSLFQPLIDFSTVSRRHQTATGESPCNQQCRVSINDVTFNPLSFKLGASLNDAQRTDRFIERRIPSKTDEVSSDVHLDDVLHNSHPGHQVESC